MLQQVYTFAGTAVHSMKPEGRNKNVIRVKSGTSRKGQTALSICFIIICARVQLLPLDVDDSSEESTENLDLELGRATAVISRSLDNGKDENGR